MVCAYVAMPPRSAGNRTTTVIAVTAAETKMLLLHIYNKQ